MLVRVGRTRDVASGGMVAFDVDGTPVAAANVGLERRGLIEALEPQDRRRPYRLTGLGATTHGAHLERLGSFMQTWLRRLGRASA